MTMKLLPILIALAAAGVAGCGGSDEPSGSPGPNEVVMTEYEFNPSDVEVTRGTQLTVRNEGEIAHNLKLRRADEELIGTDSFLCGKSETLDVDVQPGSYEMVCTVPGHEQLGMKGSMSVRAGSGGQSGAQSDGQSDTY
jgi:plastocyanin